MGSVSIILNCLGMSSCALHAGPQPHRLPPPDFPRALEPSRIEKARLLALKQVRRLTAHASTLCLVRNVQNHCLILRHLIPAHLPFAQSLTPH